MKINGRDVTLTNEELDLLKKLNVYGVIAIAKSDEDVLMWHHGYFSSQVSKINVRWFKGFDWIENDETIPVQMLLEMSKKPKTVWDLEDGDVFWAVNSRGHVYRDTWAGGDFDLECRNQGNVFLTEEEAEFESKRREVVTKVRKYARPFNHGGKNMTPYWSRSHESIGWNCSGYIQESQLYFESKEKFDQAIDEVGEEDFKKYYLGVTE